MKYPLDSEFFLNRFNNAVTKYIDEGALVRLERIPAPRSDNQNRFLWALYGLIGNATGYTQDEMHDLCREKLGLTEDKVNKVTGKVNKVKRSTKCLTTSEMSEYLDKVVELGTRLGCYMPSFDEYIKNYKEIESSY